MLPFFPLHAGVEAWPHTWFVLEILFVNLQVQTRRRCDTLRLCQANIKFAETECYRLPEAWHDINLVKSLLRQFVAGFSSWNSRFDPRDGVKQDRQSTYNVTLRPVRAAVVAVEKQWVLHNLSVCICSLRHPACNAHAPYCHMWPASLYSIFPHYLINGTIFEKVYWT